MILRRNSGSVLIVVMWACLGLVTVALLFGHSMSMAYRGADNDVSGYQAEQAIEGAARYAETVLVNVDSPGLFPDSTTYLSEAMPVGDAKFWFLRPSPDDDTGKTRAYGLVDECSKLNLNTATLAMLENLPGMTESLATAILQWRAATDSSTASGGVQSSTTINKGSPFESIEELGMVSGADWTTLYGEDANLNGVLDPNEDDGDKSFPPDNSDGKLDAGILSFVTVFSREPNLRSDGSARISVRAPSQALRDLLQTDFNASRADDILRSVGPTPCNSPLEFYVRSGMTSDEFAKISNDITASSSDFVAGLVNVNTANQTVLACIPGIDSTKAATLVATRLARVQQDTNIAWVVDTLGKDVAIQAGPYLTGQSFQVSADIAAVGAHGRGYRRTRVVIDNSSGTPRIIYRRNLAPLGWALGEETRQSAATQTQAQAK